MATTKGEAVWKGTLKEGHGHVSTESGTLEAEYSFGSRFGEDNSKTNPEELIGAAHAACYSMFLASLIEKAGHEPISVHTTAIVTLTKDERGPFISKIRLQTEGRAEGIDEAAFATYAEKARKDCPLSRALGGIPEIQVEARLLQVQA